jgi:hypothetical protein
MHLSNILLVLCLSTSVLGREHTSTAKDGAGHHNSTHTSVASLSKKCAQIQELTLLNSTLNNATKLSEIAAKDNLSAAEISQLQATAQKANLELQKLTANGTLVASCSAAMQIQKSCGELWALTELENLATNATKLDALATRRNLTSSQVAEIKSAAASAVPQYQKLNGNATLVAECKAYTQAQKQGLGPIAAGERRLLQSFGLQNEMLMSRVALKAEDPAVAFVTAINSPATATATAALDAVAATSTSTPTNAAAYLGFRYEVLGLVLLSAAWILSML